MTEPDPYLQTAPDDHNAKSDGVWVIPGLLILAIIATDLSIDMYLPSLPLLTKLFAVNADAMSLTLSIHLLGLCVSGAIFGPLSDRIGRRNTLIGGLTIFSAGALLSGLSQNLPMLVGARFIQGLGGGVSWIVALAMIKDLYDEARCSQVLSSMYMVIALAPVFTPILGSFVIAHHGWRVAFYIVAVFAFSVTLIVAAALPETLTKRKQGRINLAHIVRDYWRIASHPTFAGYAMISAITYASWWAYIAYTPYIFMNTLGVQMQDYGYYQVLQVFFYVAGLLLNRTLVATKGVTMILIYGVMIGLVGSIALVIYPYIASPNALTITCLMGIFCFGNGMVCANTATRALDVFPNLKGSASAVMSSLESIIPGITVSLAAYFFNDTMMPLALVQLGCALIAFIILILLLKPSFFLQTQNNSAIANVCDRQ